MQEGGHGPQVAEVICEKEFLDGVLKCAQASRLSSMASVGLQNSTSHNCAAAHGSDQATLDASISSMQTASLESISSIPLLCHESFLSQTTLNLGSTQSSNAPCPTFSVHSVAGAASMDDVQAADSVGVGSIVNASTVSEASPYSHATSGGSSMAEEEMQAADSVGVGSIVNASAASCAHATFSAGSVRDDTQVGAGAGSPAASSTISLQEGCAQVRQEHAVGTARGTSATGNSGRMAIIMPFPREIGAQEQQASW